MNRLDALELRDAAVADAGIADFTLFHCVGDLLPCRLQFRVRVRPVYLVQVDDIDIQSFQAGFDFPFDGLRI